MAEGKTRHEIRAKDERIPIDVKFGDSDIVAFTLYFNPADEDIELYLHELDSLIKNVKPDIKEERIKYLREKRALIDNIFGEGSATMIGRYTGLEMDLLEKLGAKVEEGTKTFKEAAEKKAKADEAEAKKKAQAAAKAEAAAFISNKK